MKHQLENLEESVRDRCKKEFTGDKLKAEEHRCSKEGSMKFVVFRLTDTWKKNDNKASSLMSEVRDQTIIFCSSSPCASDLMIEMEDHTNDLSEARIPFLDYKAYTDCNFFLSSKDGANDAMITRKLQIPEARRAIVAQALNQFSNLLNSKTFLVNVSLGLLSFKPTSSPPNSPSSLWASVHSYPGEPARF